MGQTQPSAWFSVASELVKQYCIFLSLGGEIKKGTAFHDVELHEIYVSDSISKILFIYGLCVNPVMVVPSTQT